MAHTMLAREERWARRRFPAAEVAPKARRAPPRLPPRVPDLVGAADAEEPRQYLAHCHAGLWASHSHSAQVLVKPPASAGAEAAREQESPTIAVHFLRTATLPHAMRNAAKPLLVVLPKKGGGGGKKGGKSKGGKSPGKKKK